MFDFHGKSNNVSIEEKFPLTEENIKGLIVTPNFPSLFNKIENNLFIGNIQSTIITPPLEFQTPEDDKNCDFVMTKIAYKDDDKTSAIYYRTTKDNMPPAEEFLNDYGFKLYRYKTEDGRTKYFKDNLSLTLKEAEKKWNLGYPIVVFKEGSSEKPITYFPSKVVDKPNLFLVILSNISNMDFERTSALKIEEIKDFLSENGLRQYNNLVELNKMLQEKPDFLNRKFNGFLIHNRQNLQSLLQNPPPRFGENVSKWKALQKIVKMIKDHQS